jgi:PTS system sucrose-specific IIC component
VLLPILAMAGAGQVGAALAVWFKTDNEKLKHIIKSSIVVGFLGVGEPLIYGVTLPLFRPFLAACIGGGIGGAFVAAFKLGATGIGISGIPLALLIQNGIMLYLVGILLAYAGGFIATLLIGFDDGIIE